MIHGEAKLSLVSQRMDGTLMFLVGVMLLQVGHRLWKLMMAGILISLAVMRRDLLGARKNLLLVKAGDMVTREMNGVNLELMILYGGNNLVEVVMRAEISMKVGTHPTDLSLVVGAQEEEEGGTLLEEEGEGQIFLEEEEVAEILLEEEEGEIFLVKEEEVEILLEEGEEGIFLEEEEGENFREEEDFLEEVDQVDVVKIETVNGLSEEVIQKIKTAGMMGSSQVAGKIKIPLARVACHLDGTRVHMRAGSSQVAGTIKMHLVGSPLDGTREQMRARSSQGGGTVKMPLVGINCPLDGIRTQMRVSSLMAGTVIVHLVRIG